MLISQIVSGLVSGLGYSLAAAGVALVFGVMRVINFAQGEFYMLGAMMLLILTGAGFPIGWALLVAAAVVGLVGGLIYRFLIMPVVHDEIAGLMITFGVSLIAINSVQTAVGATAQKLPRLIDGAVRFAGVSISDQLLAAGAISLIAILLLVLFLGRTGPGRRIRAAADNRAGAEVSGVRFGRTQILTFVIGTGLAALSGGLLGPQAYFTPTIGQPVLAKSFAIIVVFGLGSVGGAFWAALILGVLESLIIGYLPPGWSDAASYGLLLIVIVSVLLRDEVRRSVLRLRHGRRRSATPAGAGA